MAAPADDLRDFIAATIPLTSGLDVFAGKVLAPVADGTGVRDRSVFCRETGGTVQPTMGSAAFDVNSTGVQVTVRGNRQSPDTAVVFAEGIRAAVHKGVVEIQPSTGVFYAAVLVTEPKANDLGDDQTEHPMFTFNVTMQHTGP